MRYISLFSGIEAASVAWHPLGWEAVAFAEIEPFPSAVLAHRFPDVPNLGDIRMVGWPDDLKQYVHAVESRRDERKALSLRKKGTTKPQRDRAASEAEYLAGLAQDFLTANPSDWSAYRGSADLVCGGSPCQSFSVAGLRKGLADPRGNLALEYLRAVDGVRPEWVVWENVPGVLSADGGRAFGTFLGGLAELGYGFCYRVLDAQYVRVESHTRAVPQRRRRVFVVGCLGDWRRAAAVLLERESLCGHPAPSREAREGTTEDTSCGTLCSRTGLARGVQEAEGGHIVAFADVSRENKRQNGPGYTDAGVAFTLTVGDTPGVLEATPPLVMAPSFSKRPGQQIATRDDGVSFALTGGAPPSVLGGGFEPPAAFEPRYYTRGQGAAKLSECADGALSAQFYGSSDKAPHVVDYAVRRLTPRECERLQGFPDDWTLVEHRGKPAADGPRYKAIGNSMAVNVMRFIGERVDAVHENYKEVADG